MLNEELEKKKRLRSASKTPERITHLMQEVQRMQDWI